MRDTTFGRREFLSLVGGALASAGALAVARPERALAGGRDARLFAGQETFERLLGLARAGAGGEVPIGEGIRAVGVGPPQAPSLPPPAEVSRQPEVARRGFPA